MRSDNFKILILVSNPSMTFMVMTIVRSRNILGNKTNNCIGSCAATNGCSPFLVSFDYLPLSLWYHPILIIEDEKRSLAPRRAILCHRVRPKRRSYYLVNIILALLSTRKVLSNIPCNLHTPFF